MKDMPQKPTPEETAQLSKRAKLLGNRHGQRKIKPDSLPLSRVDFKAVQFNAQHILNLTHDGACAKLARDVVNVASQFDNLWAEIFPVFEMIDEKIKTQDCRIIYDTEGYELRSANGKILSSGNTFREWLLNHVSLYGDQITEPYQLGQE